MWTKFKIINFILYEIFARFLPISRRMRFAKWLRCFFAKKILKFCGKNVNIEKGAYFTPNVSIDDHSGIGINCELNAVDAEIIIGKYVMMGPEVIIYTVNHNYENTTIPMQLQGNTKGKSVKIGDDVWIGRRVIIMPGVEIGNGCVVGANSVVTKSIPDYAVVGGCPARIIKMRK